MAEKQIKPLRRKRFKYSKEVLNSKLMFDRLDKEVRKAKLSDEWEKAAYEVDQAKKQLYGLAPNEYRTQVLHELESRYWTIFYNVPASSELSRSDSKVEDDPIGKQFSDH